MVERLGGRLLRSFRKRTSPAMVTSADFDKIQTEDSEEFKFDEQQMQSSNGKYSVFGISLEEAYHINEESNKVQDTFTNSKQQRWVNELCTSEYMKYVPVMILKCIKFINDYGLKEEGIYRVSGSANDVQLLRHSFANEGPAYDIPPTFDVHAVTSLIKSFARELPEDILPITNRHTFLAYHPSEIPTDIAFLNGKFSLFTQEEEDMNPIVIPTQILQEILQELQPCNFALVQALTNHFQLVVQNSDSNKMKLSNLSLILCHTLKIHKSVFHALILKGPNIWADLHPKTSTINNTRMVQYDTNKILYYDNRPEEEDEGSASSISSPSTPKSRFDDRLQPTIATSINFEDIESISNKHAFTQSLAKPTIPLEHSRSAASAFFSSPIRSSACSTASGSENTAHFNSHHHHQRFASMHTTHVDEKFNPCEDYSDMISFHSMEYNTGMGSQSPDLTTTTSSFSINSDFSGSFPDRDGFSVFSESTDYSFTSPSMFPSSNMQSQLQSQSPTANAAAAINASSASSSNGSQTKPNVNMNFVLSNPLDFRWRQKPSNENMHASFRSDNRLGPKRSYLSFSPMQVTPSTSSSTTNSSSSGAASPTSFLYPTNNNINNNNQQVLSDRKVAYLRSPIHSMNA